MELYQLKYFLYAAKYENISKAAQALRVSQPSISRAVVALAYRKITLSCYRFIQLLK